MKAAVLLDKKNVRYTEIEEPFVNGDEIKVRVAAVGICGSDIPRYMEGRVHSFPLVLGHEFSGVVVEVGRNCKSVNIGDHVVGVPLLPCELCRDCQKGNFELCRNYKFVGSSTQGALAEYIVLPEKNIVKINKKIPLENAIFFEPSTVALHALRHINYLGGKKVVILGGGTIGLFVLQWTKIFGASKVVVIGRDYDHLQVAKKIGADAVISTLDKNWFNQAIDITNGYGFNYIFEAAGATQTMHIAFFLAANKSNVCFIGTPTKELTFLPSEWELLNRKEFVLTGSWMSYSAPFPGEEWKITNEFLSNNKLKIINEMIYKKYNLIDIEKAFKLFYNKERIKGKVVIII